MSLLDTLLIKKDPSKIFDISKCLGEGTFGSVWLGTDIISQQEFAIKMIEVKEEEFDDIEQEIMILKECSSPYIVGYRGTYEYPQQNRIWIVLENCRGGSVSDVMFICGAEFKEEEIKEIIACMVLGLDYLHSRNVIHRDIKTGNVLLAEDGYCRLADFGVSAVLTAKRPKRKTAIGAPFWMAPEVILETPYDGKCDVWSTGISVIELAEKKPPHHDIHPMRALFMIPFRPSPLLKEPGKWSSDMKDFLSRCVEKKPESRATIAELLKHPWISAVKDRLERDNGHSDVLKRVLKRSIPILEQFHETGNVESQMGTERDDVFESSPPTPNRAMSPSPLGNSKTTTTAANTTTKQTYVSAAATSTTTTNTNKAMDIDSLLAPRNPRTLAASKPSSALSMTNSGGGMTRHDSNAAIPEIKVGSVAERIQAYNSKKKEESVNNIRKVANANTRQSTSFFDAARPLSTVFRANKPESLVSIDLRQDKLNSIRQSIRGGGLNSGQIELVTSPGAPPVVLNQRQSRILTKAVTKQKLTMDEVFELLAQPPLTEQEKNGASSDLENMITKSFVAKLGGLL